MGVIYYVGCSECLVYRNLDKLYIPRIERRAQALDITEQLKNGLRSPLRFVLLAGFMRDHMDHACTFFDENRFALLDEWEDDGGDWWDC